MFAWLGGLAMFFAAAFGLKYSFEHNLVPPEVRAAFDRALRRQVTALAAFVPGANGEERRRRATALIAGMAGTVSTARALPDEGMRRKLLEDARWMFLRAFAG